MKKVLDTPNSPKAVGTYNQAIESNNFIFTSEKKCIIGGCKEDQLTGIHNKDTASEIICLEKKDTQVTNDPSEGVVR